MSRGLSRCLRILAIVLAACFLLAGHSTAFALADPDAVSIQSIKRYDGVAAAGDLLITVEYIITYAAVPDESIAEGWLGRLLDGSGQLASVQPYSGGLIPNSGYSRGMFSFYLASPSTTGSLFVAIEGNPSLVPTPEGITSSSIETRTPAVLPQDIRLAAQRMADDWSQVLLTALGGTLKFTTDGEDYFANAVPNLSAYADDLFIFSSNTPEFPEDPHPTAALTDRNALLDGTPVDELFAVGASYTGWSQDLIETVVMLAFGLIVAGILFAKVPDHNEIALFAVILVTLVGGGMLGLGNWYLLSGFFGFLAVVAIGWVLWLRRAG